MRIINVLLIVAGSVGAAIVPTSHIDIRPLKLSIDGPSVSARQLWSQSELDAYLPDRSSDSQSGLWYRSRLTPQQTGREKTCAPRGAGVDVYLIDSGVDADHEEFSHKPILDIFPFLPFTSTADDRIGHGTGMASIIVGRRLGVAPHATLIPVKIINQFQGSVDLLSTALLGVAELIAKRQRPAVVNFSIGSYEKRYFENHVNKIREAGGFFVAASDNEAKEMCGKTPFASEGVFGVGMYDQQERFLMPQGVGKCVNFVMPGAEVLMAKSWETDRYVPRTGTSVATALFSGVLAQQLSALGRIPTEEEAWKLVGEATNAMALYELPENMSVRTLMMHPGLACEEPEP